MFRWEKQREIILVRGACLRCAAPVCARYIFCLYLSWISITDPLSHDLCHDMFNNCLTILYGIPNDMLLFSGYAHLGYVGELQILSSHVNQNILGNTHYTRTRDWPACFTQRVKRRQVHEVSHRTFRQSTSPGEVLKPIYISRLY